jgi:hypothetical protein
MESGDLTAQVVPDLIPVRHEIYLSPGIGDLLTSLRSVSREHADSLPLAQYSDEIAFTEILEECESLRRLLTPTNKEPLRVRHFGE